MVFLTKSTAWLEVKLDFQLPAIMRLFLEKSLLKQLAPNITRYNSINPTTQILTINLLTQIFYLLFNPSLSPLSWNILIIRGFFHSIMNQYV